jgi:8-oxo-dGTP pyrophosphatase MutT (NUDIX family)
MAGSEGTGKPAPQGDGKDPAGKRKRRRRRRPRRRTGGAGGAAAKGATPTAAKGAGAKGSGRAASPKTGKRSSSSGKGSSSSAKGASSSKKGTADRRGGTKGKGRPKRSGAKRGGAKRASDRARGPKIPTTREVSAGGVVYRRADEGIEVVLASRRTRKGQLAWGLAKGGIELGETKEEAAIREVREETGMTAEIEADLGDTKYMYVWDEIRIRKTVHFFLMRHTGGDVDDRDDEMEEIRWFPLERAIKRAAYRGERDMLVKASELLR